MSRIIVTGGSGRLGRSVVIGLAQAGHEVISIDRESIDGLPAEQRVLDLTDTAATRDALVAAQPDAVVHLAAIAVPFSAPEDVILRTNTALTWNVVDGAVAAGASRVLAASSPTVIGYGSPQGWLPEYLPIDEEHPRAPWNAYALSKLVIEEVIAMAVAREGDAVRFGAFRPCFVIAPEEWHGAPTQQGHTLHERLDQPEYAAVSLFNYVDARDAADFVLTWIERAEHAPNGSVFFVGAADAFARESLDQLVPRYLDGASDLAAPLVGTSPAFSSAKAERLLGWRAKRSWRSELIDPRTDSAPPAGSASRSPLSVPTGGSARS
ncbi:MULTISPECIES: NAD(P)-dependent oxidoreductase [unclassified Rathayibacter]|uniref:NAD-dependent epimerase/dehydratase family protein n=1 Tax=unclassified Rathayibacter TaxID=2609250 RepID=UPI000F4C9AC5|nr:MULTISPECIES: NAD(P)-dependent oxidoreductase [unclassified Rathayibacter]ROP49143.1 nucleoside-diphosphate-sugar epimerase [Rathayibacter sp. PhB186]ROS50740.1 nucleoside-diphosphate-sugar epimerase [Rathayibacter sp. PhB185]